MGVLKKLLSYDTVFTEELLEKIREQYVPTNWVSGEIITATRLNHMEQGIYENSKMAENTVQQDGEYPFLTAGLAENLKSDTFTVNQTPYFIRNVINNSDREIDSVVGGSVGWNQLLRNGKFEDTSYLSVQGDAVINDVTDNVLDVSFSSESSSQVIQGWNPTSNHIFFSTVDVKLPSSSDSVICLTGGQTATYTTATYEWQTVSKLFNNPYSFWIVRGTGTAVEHVKLRNAYIVDLTILLGSTIADYIYTLETATAGAGIAKLKSWGFFAEDYYEYDAGSIKSVEGVSAHITYNADESILGDYPLDSSLVLRGLQKLSETNDLYYEGDVYSSDGTVSRYWKQVVLNGDDTYTYQPNGLTSDVSNVFIIFSDKKYGLENIKSDKFVVRTVNDSIAPFNMVGRANSAGVEFSLPVTVEQTSDAIKAWFSSNPTTLVYELATPTTETAQPFQNPQLVIAGGTEEYVSTGLVPVGHYTQYPENLKAKLESMPSLPTQEGVYVLKYDDGVASYILLETDETVVDMLARIAALEGE